MSNAKVGAPDDSVTLTTRQQQQTDRNRTMVAEQRGPEPLLGVGAEAAEREPSVVLELDGFGVAFREQVVLADVTFSVPARGVVNLFGPVGTGKSTLQRTLAGANDAQPSLRTWGSAIYAGKPIGERERPSLVIQDAKLLVSTVRENLVTGLPNRSQLSRPEQDALLEGMLESGGIAHLRDKLNEDAISLSLAEQRILAILRAVIGNPKMICLDEPTARLDDDDAKKVLRLLDRQGEQRAVMFTTHNQSHARALGGLSVLIAGGRVQACQPTEEFFTHPANAVTANFARTGSCAVPSPMAAPEDLSEGVEPPPPLPEAARDYVSHTVGPRGFYWLKKGQLGGTPRPGIVAETADDIEALRRLGVDVLVTLEESRTVDAALLAEAGIESLWFPIEDMEAPDLDAAAALCVDIDKRCRDGNIVAVHCRAGLGRTGTVLACQLVWEGQDAIEALDQVRNINRSWVQSQAQVDFLSHFANFTRAQRES